MSRFDRSHNLTDSQLLAMESIEIEAWREFYTLATGDLASAHGIGVEQIDSACVTIVAKTDVLAFNRVNGLGHGPAATPGAVDRIVVLYRNAGAARFFVQLSPIAQPAELVDWLLERGFTLYNNWIRLYRDLSPPPEVNTELRIDRINSDDAMAFGRVMIESFGWPEELDRWIALSVDRPNWYHYVARDGNQVVATAAMYVRGEDGWIDFASTLPTHRGRGAQSALLARRITDAAAMGCQQLVVETAEQTLQKEAPSYRNVTRFGFQVAYKRPNYIMVF